MAGRHQNSMPSLPSQDGGYEFEVVELGPPSYFSQPPVVNARGTLIPLGDGEGLTNRPAPPMRSKSPKRKWQVTERTPPEPATSGITQALLRVIQKEPDGPSKVKMMDLLIRLDVIRMMREYHDLNPKDYNPHHLASLIEDLLSPEIKLQRDFINTLQMKSDQQEVRKVPDDLITLMEQLKALLGDFKARES